MTRPVNPPVWLSNRQAAEYLGLEPRTLNQWRWLQKGPAFYRVGGAIRYSLDDLDAYLANGRVEEGAGV